jgi:hypothetical protein
MNVILLYIDHRHVLDTRVAIFDYIYNCILAIINPEDGHMSDHNMAVVTVLPNYIHEAKVNWLVF